MTAPIPPKSLAEAAHGLGAEIHSGRWSHVRDFSTKPAPACKELIDELERRWPGRSQAEYQAALSRGLQESMV